MGFSNGISMPLALDPLHPVSAKCKLCVVEVSAELNCSKCGLPVCEQHHEDGLCELCGDREFAKQRSANIAWITANLMRYYDPKPEFSGLMAQELAEIIQKGLK